jgi:cytochrome oxidase Cu insertion factor (SCO1/SenC/PrrC family)
MVFCGPMSGRFLAIAAAFAAVVTAQTPTDVTAVGPKVGEKAIAFALTDQNGRQQTLASLAGPKGTMLVFFRSADW